VIFPTTWVTISLELVVARDAFGAAVIDGQYWLTISYFSHAGSGWEGRLTYKSTLLAIKTQEGVGMGLQTAVTSPTEQRGRSVGTGVIAGSVALSNVVGMPWSSR
jgi:hypothetical protein